MTFLFDGSSIKFQTQFRCNDFIFCFHCSFPLNLGLSSDYFASVTVTNSLQTGAKVTLHVDPQAKPKFFKPCILPFSFKEKVESWKDWKP